MAEVSIERTFFKTLDALSSYTQHLVIVGGWVPYLYSHYFWPAMSSDIPFTHDIDFGVKETRPRVFEEKVYDRLKKNGLVSEPLYEEEPTPVKFLWKEGKNEVPVDFITSDEVSDDTWNRFLGADMSWNRIESFEILLKHTLHRNVSYEGKTYSLEVPTPAAFLYHKGITFTERSEDNPKRFKDLYWVWWIANYYPEQKLLMEELKDFKKDVYFHLFQTNIKKYLKDPTKPGYPGLAPFLSHMGSPSDIIHLITRVMKPILDLI